MREVGPSTPRRERTERTAASITKATQATKVKALTLAQVEKEKIPLQRVKQLRVGLAQARSRPPNPRQKVSCSCIRSGKKCTNGRVQKVG